MKRFLTKQFGAKGQVKPRNNKTCRPHLEALEGRTLMAGDIAVATISGTLQLSEAAGQAGLNNAVLIRQLDNGMLRIEGAVTSDGTKSLVNGAAFRDFQAPAGLSVTFGDGKDRVTFFSGLGPIPDFQSVSIAVGIAGAIGDADQDIVSISNLSADALTISTGASNDNIFVSAGTTIQNDLSIMTGAAADTVSIRDGTSIGTIDIRTYDSLSETDVDLVFFEKRVANAFSHIAVGGNVNVRLGGGRDQLVVFDGGPDTGPTLGVAGAMFVDTGTGADQVRMAGFNVGSAAAGSLTIRTGTGLDTIDINTRGLVNGNLDIQTAGDADRVQLEHIQVLGNLLVNLGGGDDKFFITDPQDAASNNGIHLAGSLQLVAGAGNDQVHVEGSHLSGSVSIDTGDHNDRVSMVATDVGDDLDHVVNFVVQTGTGGDEVTLNLIGRMIIGDVTIQTYASLAETDADQVHILGGIVNGNLFTGLGGTVQARLGGGNDFFELQAPKTIVDLDLEMGAGNDTVALSGYIFDHAIARMGEGNDLLTLGDISGYRLIALGDGGFDQLVGTANIDTQNRDLYGWEIRDDTPVGP